MSTTGYDLKRNPPPQKQHSSSLVIGEIHKNQSDSEIPREEHISKKLKTIGVGGEIVKKGPLFHSWWKCCLV